MPNLPIGPYRLEVSLQGFRTYVQTGIVLQVDARPTINVALALGNVEETISVEGAAPLVDVRSAGISTVVDQERIVELPLQGRQVTDLIILAGAAVETDRPNSRNFQGGVEWLRSLGVTVIDLDSEECAAMLGEYIRANPEVWNEDIGEE